MPSVGQSVALLQLVQWGCLVEWEVKHSDSKWERLKLKWDYLSTSNHHTSEAYQATQQLLSGGSSFLSPAMQAYQQLGEQPSAVSQLSGLAEGLLAPTREKIISQFERGGRSGSGAFGEALARGETTALAPFLQAALAEDNRRKQAAAAGLADIGRLGIGEPSTGNKLLSSTVGPLIEKGIGSLGGFLTGYGAPSSVSSPISAISTPDTGYRVPQMSTFLSDIGLGN